MTRPRKAPSLGATQPSPSDPRAADEAQREWMADQLVRLGGRRAQAALDPRDPAHAGYLEWLANERRALLSPAERAALAAEGEQFAARVLALSAHAATTSDEIEPATRVMGLVLGDPVVREPVHATSGFTAVREAAEHRCASRPELAVCAGPGRELWDEPCTAWVELPPGVPDGLHVALSVHGDSMEPMLHAGDTLLVRVGQAATVGDVIVARRPEDGYVVKRVAAVEERALVLASANAAYADVRIPRDESLVVGTVVLRWCTHPRAM